jgi:Tfp pilus assembly protein PilN
MREPEFLPNWYPMLRRKRRYVILQSWLTAAVVIALGMWMLLSERNVHAAESAVDSLQSQLSQSNGELKKLDELQSLRRQMTQQAQVVAHLGLHIPTARMIDALGQVMPAKMALLDLTLNTEQRAIQQSPLLANSGVEPQVDRRLRVKLHGVVPTDVDLGDFLGHLSNVPFFRDIAMPYSKDRVQSGHVMREFEVTFAVDLNQDER